MKYWAPINSPGGINGNDSYVNANPSIGVQGSIPTFQSFEQPLRGLQNLVLGSRLSPNSAMDDTQIPDAIRSQQMNYVQQFGGTPNQLTAVFTSPALASLAMIAAMPIRGIAISTNTGPATLVAGGLPERPIVTALNKPLVAGDITANLLYTFYYNSALDRYVMGQPNGGAGTGGGDGPPGTAPFEIEAQPCLFASNSFVMGENVPIQPGGYAILPNTKLGDANFNTASGTFQVGPQTIGTYAISVAATPPTTYPHNTFTIVVYSNNPVYAPRSGVAMASATMIDWDGGYATHLCLSGVIHFSAPGQVAIVAYYSLHSQAYLGFVSLMRIAGGPGI